MNPIETLYGPGFFGPPVISVASKSNQFAGRTTLSSGSATVTVSSTVIGSDSIIRLAMQTHVRQNSGFGQPVEVASISPGNFFTLSTADGVAFARDTTIMWDIVKSAD